MGNYTRAGLLKRGILLFWSIWISIVVLMNLGDVLRAVGVLPADWNLASKNYEAIVHVTSVYGTPKWLDFILMLGVICWETGAAILFWWALRRYWTAAANRWHSVYLAFIALLGIFGVFILMDEIFQKYGIEGDHRGISILLLASLLAVQLLPDQLPKR